MNDALTQLKEQHISNYKNAIIDIINNNTNVLVDEDIMSLLRKPPLDSMDLIRVKFLDLAKKNKIILNTEELSNILDNYRDKLMNEIVSIKVIRIKELSKDIDKNKYDENEVFKLNKKDFTKVDKDIKKILKDQLEDCFNKYILKKIESVFSDDIDSNIKNDIVTNIKKYINGSYQRQLLENFDIKVLVKDTTLINNIKEQNERYLFTINNSRILNDLDE